MRLHLVLKRTPAQAKRFRRFSDVAMVLFEVVGDHFALTFP
jgi:hypothetical protein